MLAHSLRHWPNIKITLNQHLMFAGFHKPAEKNVSEPDMLLVNLHNVNVVNHSISVYPTAVSYTGYPEIGITCEDS